MKIFIFAILLFLMPSSMLFPQDYLHEIRLNDGKIIIGTIATQKLDTFCIRLLDDTQKCIYWYDIKSDDYVEFSRSMKPLRDTMYTLTDTSDIEYTGLVMKDTSNYIIFKTGYNEFKIFRKYNILKMEPYPVEMKDNWIWNKESCKDRLLYSHTGIISPAGKWDISDNELVFLFLSYSLTDWIQISLETTESLQPLWLQLRTGKEIFKHFYASIGILDEINNENDYYTSKFKFKTNNAAVYYINTFQIKDFGLTAGIYYPFYSNFNIPNYWYEDETFVHLFYPKVPTYLLGFDWRFHYNLALVNENLFIRQHNFYSLLLKFIMKNFFIEFGIFASNKPLWGLGEGANDISWYPMFNFGFSF